MKPTAGASRLTLERRACFRGRKGASARRRLSLMPPVRYGPITDLGYVLEQEFQGAIRHLYRSLNVSMFRSRS